MKNLMEYNFPQDLKSMSDKDLSLLSTSIRDFLIDKVSKTGGHLASNLGVVELTIALHKVFDSPVDKIIWDVGHQAYVHKILTGRADKFDNLRQFNGLSGFPKACESEHDVFDTGHSTTSISAAAGMAAARDIKGEKYEVVAVIGDGSMTGGMAFEALNNIGDRKQKVIVILNDNGMSISPNIGGLSAHLGNLRTSRGYINLKNFIKNRVGTIPGGRGLADVLAGFKNDIKYTVLEEGGVLFEELGFTYFGPVDGHNITDLINAFNRAKSLNEPVIIHVLTKKGKGYKNAENNPGKFHGIGPFNAETGETLKKSGISYSEVMGNYLVKKASSDNKIVAITAAMGDATGLGNFEKEFPKRFFDVGIAEQHAVTFAAGLAKSGLKPVVAIYSSFMQRAYDQLIHDVCMQNLPVVFCLDRAGVVGADGETHHGVFDLSFLMSMPNMTVLTPADGNQLEAMLDYAIKLNSPVAIRYPRGEAVYDKNIMSTGTEAIINERILPPGKIDIWACGKMASCGAETVEILKKSGFEAGLVKVGITKPLDISAYESSADLIVTLEDNTVAGGFGQTLAAALADKNTQVMTIGWPDQFIRQGSFEQLADKYGLTAEKIAERICEHIEGKA
ncbi:MAG: 1-deoxy-D-xylulose-5-phosphate synthase [Firmicutes bacterium]|nr:1-deoxy-D-xylulose-5-phosphate synthase [Bacillota bacterium]